MLPSGAPSQTTKSAFNPSKQEMIFEAVEVYKLIDINLKDAIFRKKNASRPNSRSPCKKNWPLLCHLVVELHQAMVTSVANRQRLYVSVVYKEQNDFQKESISGQQIKTFVFQSVRKNMCRIAGLTSFRFSSSWAKYTFFDKT